MAAASPAPQPTAVEPLVMARPVPFVGVPFPFTAPDGTAGVGVRYEHATGTTVLMATAEDMLKHGQELVRVARAQRSGLTVPTSAEMSAFLRP